MPYQVTEGGGNTVNGVALKMKLARQLDFTSTTPIVIFPKHQHQHQQNQIPKSNGLPIQPRRPQTPLPVIQAKSSSPAFVVPPPPIHTEFPSGRPWDNAEVKGGTRKKLKRCNCRLSQCLKLYCKCFASGVYCDGCSCKKCSNNVENESSRKEAVKATLERNANAFQPMIASSPHGMHDTKEEKGDVSMTGMRKKGCQCKKSGCLKIYCECFQAKILCSENCKCMDCKNYADNQERHALFNVFVDAANAAVTGAVGSSGYGYPFISKKRELHEKIFHTTAKDSPFHRLAQTSQANHLRPSSTFSASSSSPGVPAVNPAPTGSSKPTYRSLLADVLQPQQIKDLCRIMVLVANAVSKSRTTGKKKATVEKQSGSEEHAESIAAPSSRQSMSIEAGNEEASADDSASGNLAEKICMDDPRSDGSELQKERPISPGTLSLMFNEQDRMSMEAASPNGRLSNGVSIPLPSAYGPETAGLYAEQERRVLTAFRDSLQNLVHRGTIKGMRG